MTTITSAPLPLKLASEYTPAGDQPAAIDALVNGLRNGVARQTLLGVTGSGKTFTIANVIEQTQRPAIIMAPNKTLAAQLYGEMQSFFPDNAVAYFVSYYDYYQPEAYVPASDTHIEKDASINAHIEQMRLAATKALLERPDAIIVASVSAIYGLGDPINYQQLVLRLRVGETVGQRQLLRRLAELQYRRNEVDFFRGYFRVRGDIIEVFPAESEQTALRIELFDDDIDAIHEFDPLTGELLRQYDSVSIHPTTHYVTARERIDHAVTAIRDELAERLDTLRALNKLVEAQRLEQRVRQDLEMLMQLGYCPGIENYSRHLAGLEENEPPYTLLDYLPDNALMIIDESHVAVPQVGAMFRGDRSRKQTLVDYGFRLPSALDNRPLRFEEFEARMPQTIFVSATPGNYEREHSERVVEQLVRPTGLVDPQITIRPAKTQVDDMLAEIRRAVAADERVLITTLTKRMAEDLTDFLFNHGVRVRYLHSDIDTIERIDIIRDLRLGTFDVLVGINLLREGLDMPEVAVVAIFDADKEGFLRSDTSLIQTIGRAARHINGRVLLYADTITGSMQRAMDETERRRNKQLAYNSEHGITPQTIRKAIRSSLRDDDTTGDGQDVASVAVVMTPDKLAKTLKQLEKQMREHANNLEFELAAAVRDQMTALKRVNWQH